MDIYTYKCASCAMVTLSRSEASRHQISSGHVVNRWDKREVTSRNDYESKKMQERDEPLI